MPDIVWHTPWIAHVTAWGRGEQAVLDQHAGRCRASFVAGVLFGPPGLSPRWTRPCGVYLGWVGFVGRAGLGRRAKVFSPGLQSNPSASGRRSP